MAIFYIPPNMQGEVTIEENTGDFNWVPINNSDALWPLSGGSWGRIMIADYNHDCYLDIMIQGEWNEGNVTFCENISTTAGEYNFVEREDVADRVTRYHEVDMTFCDWNKDGIPDMLSMGECGNVYYLVNNAQTTN